MPTDESTSKKIVNILLDIGPDGKLKFTFYSQQKGLRNIPKKSMDTTDNEILPSKRNATLS